MKIIDFNCECQECGKITSFPRQMHYYGNNAQIFIPFSVVDLCWKCEHCGIVWQHEMTAINATKEFEATEGDMPLIEGSVG